MRSRGAQCAYAHPVSKQGGHHDGRNDHQAGMAVTAGMVIMAVMIVIIVIAVMIHTLSHIKILKLS